MAVSFTERERAILAMVQADLPETLTPYADIAAATGSTESEVLALLQRLGENGAIRRFGASIRHQRTDWQHNAMVAWRATPDEAEVWGPVAAAQTAISHVYFRPSPTDNWPYTLYTMIHGRTEAECLAVVEELRNLWPLDDYAVLRTIRELKKTSMTYF